MKAQQFASFTLAFAACWAAFPGHVFAEAVPNVEITALKHPAAWPYATLLAGLDEFEDQKSMAPEARLAFRLRPDRADTALNDIIVKLETDTRDYTVPLDNGTFSLPRLPSNAQEHARIALNQREHQFSFHMPRAEVRTAGLPDDTLRLGDLRLACKVNMAIFKKSIGFLRSLGLTALARRSDWCRAEGNGGQSVDAPFTYRVLTIQADSRSERQTFDRPRQQVKLPLDKSNWPDSTLIRLEP